MLPPCRSTIRRTRVRPSSSGSNTKTRRPKPARPPADERGLLSGREVEVAALVGSGATNEEIADALYISEGTAKNLISKILRKLDLRDRTQFALYAAERGWN